MDHTLASQPQQKDIRLDVKVRNNLILLKMEDADIMNVAELSRQSGIPRTTLDQFINMTISPLTEELGWRPAVIQLADFFKCLPEDLFSDTHIQNVLDTNRSHAEMNFAEAMLSLAEDRAAKLLPENILAEHELARCLREGMNTLSPRQRHVLAMRFGFDGEGGKTLAEIGAILGVSPERARGIEQGALRSLRHPSRSEVLREFLSE